jgi:signal transduction histidine kinase
MDPEKVGCTHKGVFGKVDDSKADANVTVARQPLETNEVSLLKERLTALLAALGSAHEHERNLQCSLDDALRVNRSRTELIAAFGHDLRQPLTVILAILEGLERDLPTDCVPCRVRRLRRAALNVPLHR